MRIIREGEPGAVTALLTGELDEHSAPMIRRELDSLIEGGVKRIEFDMSGVTFMDSAGVGLLLGRYNKLAASGGSMGVKNAPRSIERLLRMSGVYTLCTERSGQ